MIDLEILDNKSKNVIFDNYFLNVNFSITKAYIALNFCLPCLHTHLEGTVLQIFYLGPGFYFMTKNGKHLRKIVKIIFQVT